MQIAAGNVGCCFPSTSPVSGVCDYIEPHPSAPYMYARAGLSGHATYLSQFMFTYGRTSAENEPRPYVRYPNDPVIVPDPAEEAEPEKLPRPYRKRQPEPGTYNEPGVLPQSRRQPEPLPQARLNPRPPGPGVREAKIRAVYGVVATLMNMATESKDLVEALHKALPASLQCYYRDGSQQIGYADGEGERFHKGSPTGKSCTMAGMMQAVYQGIGKLGEGETAAYVGDALQNIVNNEVADRIYGKFARDAATTLGRLGMPFPLAGPAL